MSLDDNVQSSGTLSQTMLEPSCRDLLHSATRELERLIKD